MRLSYFIWAVLLLLPQAAEAQQLQPAASPGSTAYTIFLRGTPIGREDVIVVQDGTGVTIASTGRLAAPVNVLLRRAEVKYRPDWTPEYLIVDADVQGAETNLRTSFSDVTALAEGLVRGQKISHTDVIGSIRPFVLPNIFFGAYEAISRRLTVADVGTPQRAYFAPQSGDPVFRVTAVANERMQTGTTPFDVRRYSLTFETGGAPLQVQLYSDTRGGLLRVTIPAQGLDVVRNDLASSTARMLVYSNPGDQAVVIPALGFNLGATITRPSMAAARPSNGRYPAVVLIGGAAINDRDGVIAGVPILGQLAGAIAEAGIFAARYDKRGYGQSGGRAESTTLGDLADDARAVVRWLANQPDVDRDRIAVLGYAEGAWIAMLTAAREGRVSAIVSIAAPASTGNELVLEQQRQALAQLNSPEAERAEKIALQQRINAAVISGRGWEGIAPELRAQADTPWFQSLLQFDPAEALEDVEEPVLFVHGQLDMQVPVSHVERIVELARTRSDSRAVAVVTVRGVNHLLAPATTGQVSEYATLQDRNVSRDVTSAVTSWLQKTFTASR